jgi:hypothetical protein
MPQRNLGRWNDTRWHVDGRGDNDARLLALGQLQWGPVLSHVDREHTERFEHTLGACFVLAQEAAGQMNKLLFIRWVKGRERDLDHPPDQQSIGIDDAPRREFDGRASGPLNGAAKVRIEGNGWLGINQAYME